MVKKVKYGRIVLLVILIIAVLGYFIYPTDKVAASVNGEIIKESLLNQYHDRLPEQYKMLFTKEQLLDQLVTEKLLLQQANVRNIEATEEEVEGAYQESLLASGLSEEEFMQQLELQGVDKEFMRDYYRKQFAVNKLLNETILQKVKLEDSELEAYFEANKEQYKAIEGQIRASHILLKTEEEALDVLAEYFKEKDFVGLAKKYSIGPSGSKGGDLGFFAKGQMVFEFEETAFKLNVGQVSKPLETQFGWHLIKRELPYYKFEDVKDSLISQLIKEKQQLGYENYVKQLKEEADITIYFGEIKQDSNLEAVVETMEEESTEMVAETKEIEEKTETIEVIEVKTIEEVTVETETITESIQINEEKTCVEKYGLDKNTLIFYYADSTKCEQCQEMMLIVFNLEKENYKFYHAEYSNKESLNVLDCFPEKPKGVPQFICPNSGHIKLGKMSEQDLRIFAESC